MADPTSNLESQILARDNNYKMNWFGSKTLYSTPFMLWECVEHVWLLNQQMCVEDDQITIVAQLTCVANTYTANWVFLETRINPFNPLSFPSTFISSCKVLGSCVHMPVFVCGALLRCYCKRHENLQRENEWGWITPMRTPINLCFFYSHPPTKFISLCWNTQRKPHIG